MSARISCISLPVKNLKKSLQFYRDGIGLSADGLAELADGEKQVSLQIEGAQYLVLLTRQSFSEYAEKAKQTVADSASSECIFTYFASTQHEVDEILKRAEKNGGSVFQRPMLETPGYTGYVKDPDGHIWEIMLNPNLGTDFGQQTD